MRVARRRGFALMDFIAGSIILAGAVTAWAAITHAQLDSLAYADRRVQARNAATRALEEARAEGVAPLASASAPAGAAGWRLLRTFPVAGLMSPGKDPVGRLEVRPLRVEGEAEHGDRPIFEVRSVIEWKLPMGSTELEMSTAIGGGP